MKNLKVRAGVRSVAMCAALVFASGAASAATETFIGGGFDIPDADAAGASGNLTATGSGAITGLEVMIAMDHTWAGDLTITLTGPDSTSITLVDRPGEPAAGDFGDSSNFSIDVPITFTDSSLLPAEALGAGCPGTNDIIGIACPGIAAPTDPLATFLGMDFGGMWTLSITDNAAGDEGLVDHWALTVDYDAAAVPVPAAVWLLGSALFGLGVFRRKS